MSTPLHSVFASLRGDWSLRRAIWQEAVTEDPLIFTGAAFFEPASELSYAYHEEGELVAAAGPLGMRRRYAFSYDGATSAMTIRHWDAGPGKMLHILRCEGGMIATHRHICGDDVYDVSYDFGSVLTRAPTFSSTYRVRGPRKNYRMRSVFMRHGSQL